MAYIWSPALETGHEKIDEQHRQLFDTLNSIAAAFWGGRGSQEITKTLAFLTEYTIMHFSTEEELMEKNAYSGYAAHKKRHDDFKVTVTGLAKKLEKEGPCEDFIVNVTAIIGDWLISHIKVEDTKMASFLTANNN